MDALKRVRRKSHDGLERELAVIPVDSKQTPEKLLRILGDAVWKWAQEEMEVHETEAVLDKVWKRIDRLPANTTGCKLWKNSHKPGFPHRAVCYSKTPKSCSLGNTPGKISRLEFGQGVEQVLGLRMAWCHLDLLLREMNARCSSKGSKESISKSTFVTSLWPYVSKHAFNQLLAFPYCGNQLQPVHDKTLPRTLTFVPQNARLDKSLLQESLQSEIDPDDL